MAHVERLVLTTLISVQFPSTRGEGRPGGAPGVVDYRLDRRRLLRAFRAGSLDREDVCDAQIEVLRVAKNYSSAAPVRCPVCDERSLRHVRFVFGPRLPANGRCINSAAELERLAQKSGTYHCYLVEVCLDCRWNHLLSTFPLRSQRSA